MTGNAWIRAAQDKDVWWAVFETAMNPQSLFKKVFGAGKRSRYSDWLRAGRSGDRMSVGARFSAPVQIGPGAHPASCTMGTRSFPRVKSGLGVTLTPHSPLLPWSRKSGAIPLLPLRAVRPVHSLSACTRVHFFFLLLQEGLCARDLVTSNVIFASDVMVEVLLSKRTGPGADLSYCQWYLI